MRLELTRVGLLVELANHYTTRDASELTNLAYNFSDGILSEWIGDYLDDLLDVSSKELFEQISAQYGEFANPADFTQILI